MSQSFNIMGPLDWSTGQPMYRRERGTAPRIVDEFEAGFGWIAHPDEAGQRASHVIIGKDGAWILDPVDAVGIVDRIEDLGPVAGVAVCSSWHARDAGMMASRFDVPVAVPSWLSRVRSRIEAPVLDYGDTFPDAAFTLHPRRRIPRFEEAILYHEPTATLYVPDSLGTTPHHALPDEVIAPPLTYRFAPPTQLGHLSPDRILVGHGIGIHEYATQALRSGLESSRRRFPQALWYQLRPTIRNGIAAIRG